MPVFFSLLFGIALISSAARAEQQLVILNWSDYLDPEVVTLFEQEYQVKVSEVYFNSDDDRTRVLLENNAQGYDLILSSGGDLAFYANRGWIRPLDFNKLPNRQHIKPRWLSAFDKAEEYAIPYFWGTLGIVYRADKVSRPIRSWKQLFQPDKELQGKIVLTNNSWELLGISLKAEGFSWNSENKVELAKAEESLKQQQPYISSYNYLTTDETSAILGDEVVAALMYNGDSLMLSEYSDQLIYILPEEGSNIWIDYLTIGSGARNPDLAYLFLDFINRPDIAAKQAQFVYFATPNIMAERLLPDDFTGNPVIYPAPDSLKASEFYHPSSARGLRYRNNIISELLRNKP